MKDQEFISVLLGNLTLTVLHVVLTNGNTVGV